MSAADVPVAMPSLGGASGEWGVMLASDDVRDGALAISLARRTKNEARTALILALAPALAPRAGGGFWALASRLRAARGADGSGRVGPARPRDRPDRGRPRFGFQGVRLCRG